VIQAFESSRCPCYDVVRAFIPMQPIHLLREPIEDINLYRSELAALQGNILQNHARRHAAHIFLRFTEGTDPKLIRDRIAQFAPSITSAWDQLADIREDMKDRLFTGICLSGSAYEYLGIPTSGFLLEFSRGMRVSAQRLRILHNPWEAHLVEPHVLIIVAHRDYAAANSACNNVIDRFSDVGDVSVEWGHVISETPDGQAREHFGFADGLSQPRFIREATQNAPTRWDDSAGPRLVLTSVTFNAGLPDVGSYYVYWKLEQDVTRFEAEVQALAEKLGVTPDLAGALVFGRFKDGSPIARSSHGLNDFNYADDPAGRSCPIFAHIRKMNPRGTSRTPLDTERGRRIARRGITYGYNPEREQRPGHGVGLLFQSCQADLARQFEHLVTMWGRDPDFPEVNDGSDPLLGPSHEPQRWPLPQEGANAVKHAFTTCVKSMGGAYFFIPGIPFLTAIGKIP
jgi:Dyp-type peroxidase family